MCRCPPHPPPSAVPPLLKESAFSSRFTRFQANTRLCLRCGLQSSKLLSPRRAEAFPLRKMLRLASHFSIYAARRKCGGVQNKAIRKIKKKRRSAFQPQCAERHASFAAGAFHRKAISSAAGGFHLSLGTDFIEKSTAKQCFFHGSGNLIRTDDTPGMNRML